MRQLYGQIYDTVKQIPEGRVVNAKGELSGAFAFGSFDEQRRRLEAEGVCVTNFKVDLREYGVDW